MKIYIADNVLEQSICFHHFIYNPWMSYCSKVKSLTVCVNWYYSIRTWFLQNFPFLSLTVKLKNIFHEHWRCMMPNIHLKLSDCQVCESKTVLNNRPELPWCSQILNYLLQRSKSWKILEFKTKYKL